MTTIDFTRALADAKSASFEALPIGDYDVEVIEASATRSSNGKPMIKAQMRVISGGYANRRVFNNFVLSLENAQAMSIFFRHMKCFGLEETFFASLGQSGSLDPVAHALVSRRAKLTLGMRKWQGEDRNEVTQVKPYTGAPSGGPSAGPTPNVGPATVLPLPATPAQPQPGPAPMPAPPMPQPVAAQPTSPVPPTPPVAPVAPQPVAQPTPPQDVPREGLSEFAQLVTVPTSAAPGGTVEASPAQPSHPSFSEAQSIQPIPPAPTAAPDLPI